jgi:hypothetical protein
VHKKKLVCSVGFQCIWRTARWKISAGDTFCSAEWKLARIRAVGGVGREHNFALDTDPKSFQPPRWLPSERITLLAEPLGLNFLGPGLSPATPRNYLQYGAIHRAVLGGRVKGRGGESLNCAPPVPLGRAASFSLLLHLFVFTCWDLHSDYNIQLWCLAFIFSHRLRCWCSCKFMYWDAALGTGILVFCLVYTFC